MKVVKDKMSLWRTCPKCNVTHHSGKFCYDCGTPTIEYEVYCECGNRFYQKDKFCSNCGKSNPKPIGDFIKEYWEKSRKEG